MIHVPTALRAILCQAGIRPQIASRIEKIIEQDDYVGLTGDDIAAALFKWVRWETKVAIERERREAAACPFVADVPGQLELPLEPDYVAALRR
jgi:hypothetical protein